MKPTVAIETSVTWRRAAMAIYLALALETIFALPYRSLSLASFSNKAAWLAGLSTVAFVLVLFRWRHTILSTLAGLAAKSRSMRHWYTLWLILGLIMRLAWALGFPTTLKSDDLVYFSQAASLAKEHAFHGAFWPPGFPLFLAPFFAILGAHVWVTILCSLLMFVASYYVTSSLARALGGDFVARIACVVLTLWPSYWTLTQVNAKEALLLLLVTSNLLLLVKASAHRLGSAVKFIAFAGALGGLTALTQPGYLLFAAVVFIFFLLNGSALPGATMRTAVYSLAMMCVVLPWTCRNYLAMHHYILISMNGGTVFFAANNSQANASYLADIRKELPADDFEADKEGYRRGKQWVREHPLDFAGLMVRKQVTYLGDDSIGAYESLRRDLQPTRFYAVAKGFSNAYWLAIWILLFLGALRIFQPKWLLWFSVCFVPLLYQYSIDSVFESAGRHHVPYIPLMAIMVGLVLAQSDETPGIDSGNAN